MQELFENVYFCQEQKAVSVALATVHTLSSSSVAGPNVPMIRDRITLIGQSLWSKAFPYKVSFFEKGNNAHFNSLAWIDADGSLLGVYRKSHIPDGPGYQEKFYFTPGDTGFMVVDTAYGRLGAAICWDQWFPESARALALQGAEVIFYPTAIGTEPTDPSYNSYPHWARTMLGHAAANMVGVVLPICGMATQHVGPNAAL
eukprot:jgi/Chrzof1/1447/Cz10g08090.t1